MKTIKYWDPRFAGRGPMRLTVEDSVASAFVRAGVAAAADPAEQGALAAGAALDPGSPTEVVLQHGLAARTTRVVLPLAVAVVAVAAGVAAAVGVAVVPPVDPGIFLNGFWSDAAAWSDLQAWSF